MYQRVEYTNSDIFMLTEHFQSAAASRQVDIIHQDANFYTAIGGRQNRIGQILTTGIIVNNIMLNIEGFSGRGRQRKAGNEGIGAIA